MSRFLIVAFEFAPVNSTGAHRSIKLVRELNRLGHKTDVITFEPTLGSKIFSRPIEEALLEGILPHTEIHYLFGETKTAKLGVVDKIKEYFRQDEFLSDTVIESFRNTINKLINSKEFDYVYFSLPPFNTRQLVSIAKQKINAKVICDMRDAWSLWCLSPNRSYLHYRIKRQQERKLFRQADLILGVTKEQVQDFRNQHPKIPSSKFLWVPNSIDIEFPVESNYAKKHGIRIGYFGSFYYQIKKDNTWWKNKPHRWFFYYPRKEDWKYRSPYFFLETLSELKKKRSDITFELIGNEPKWLKAMLEELEIASAFTGHGFQTKSNSLKLMSEMDFLLITSEKIENGDHYCLPSKIFDYLKFSKPLLSFSTKGSVTDFVNNANIGYVINPDDELKKRSEALEKLIDNDISLTRNTAYLNIYSVSSCTNILLQKLDTL